MIGVGNILPFETIRKIMKEKCKERQISDKAVVVLSIYIEEYVRKVTEKSIEVLEEMNENCEIQKIRKQVRLDDKCIQKGISIINQEEILKLPDTTGRRTKKENKKYAEQSQFNESLVEVV